MDAGSFGIFGIYTATLLLGILHAIEPGHGKTVVAAYLVGTRGRNIDAVILGMVVTFTHTFSIIILAVIAKFTSRYFSEEVLHSYLGIVSSLIILGIGIWMLKTRWAVIKDPAKAHQHLFHSHDHSRGQGSTCDLADKNKNDSAEGIQASRMSSPDPLKLRGLVLLGISGGIIPCPAAIAILLASVSTGNIGKGLGLVIVFSMGLAIALVAIGLVIINSVRLGHEFINTEKFAPAAAFLSAVVITLAGAVTLYSSLRHLTG